jgi:hypothetical protein
VAAAAATLLAVIVLFYAGALFVYAVGDAAYDNDPRILLVASGATAMLGGLFAWLAVVLFRSTLPRS